MQPLPYILRKVIQVTTTKMFFFFIFIIVLRKILITVKNSDLCDLSAKNNDKIFVYSVMLFTV